MMTLIIESDYMSASQWAAAIPGASDYADTMDAASRALSTKHFDAIIVGLGSIGIGNIELLHRALPEIPLLVIAGHSDANACAECLMAGAADYISKTAMENNLTLLASRLTKAIQNIATQTGLFRAAHLLRQAAKQLQTSHAI